MMSGTAQQTVGDGIPKQAMRTDGAAGRIIRQGTAEAIS